MLTKGTAALLLVLSLTACGGSDDTSTDKRTDKATDKPTSGTTISTPGKTPTSGPTLPDCTSIWNADSTLPKDYTGCQIGGRTRLEQSTACKDKTTLIIHDEQFYAVTGQKIVMPAIAPLEDSEAFGKLYSACTGG